LQPRQIASPGQLRFDTVACDVGQAVLGEGGNEAEGWLICPSELQLLIDPRKLIQCRASGLAVFLIELDQIGK